MTRFFRLTDDVTIPGRWHLGEVLAADGSEPRLRVGITFGRDAALAAQVSTLGQVLDFSLTSFGVPIATAALADAIGKAAPADVECLPVQIAGQSGMQVLNAVRLLACLDESRSEYVKWTRDDHRSDLAGQYRQVTKLVVDPARIPGDAHFFRIEAWAVALIVSDRVKATMESAGCFGAVFQAV